MLGKELEIFIMSYLRENGGMADRRSICHALCSLVTPLAVFNRIRTTEKYSNDRRKKKCNLSYDAAARSILASRIHNMARRGIITIEDGIVYLTSGK